MFPESKVTEIYCMADDFCKEFTLQQEKYMILKSASNLNGNLNCSKELEHYAS